MEEVGIVHLRAKEGEGAGQSGGRSIPGTKNRCAKAQGQMRVWPAWFTQSTRWGEWQEVRTRMNYSVDMGYRCGGHVEDGGAVEVAWTKVDLGDGEADVSWV